MRDESEIEQNRKIAEVARQYVLAAKMLCLTSATWETKRSHSIDLADRAESCAAFHRAYMESERALSQLVTACEE